MSREKSKNYPTEFKTADDPLYKELKQLRKEVARLTEERNILKKAAAYFAKDHL